MVRRKAQSPEPQPETSAESTVDCLVCGKPFTPRTPRQKLCCLECFLQSKEQRELHREYLRE